MKKSAKKLISYAMALSCLTSISGVGASAKFDPNDRSTFPEYMQNDEFVYYSDKVLGINKYCLTEYYVYHNNETGFFDVISITPDFIDITVKTELGVVEGYEGLYATENEEVTAIVESYLPEEILEDFNYYHASPHNAVLDEEGDITYPTFNPTYTYHIRVSENPEILSNSKEMIEKISEITEVQSFKLKKGYAQTGGGGASVEIEPYGELDDNPNKKRRDLIEKGSPSPTVYRNITAEELEGLKKYVEDNNLDFTANVYDMEPDVDGVERFFCRLEPNENISLQEHFAVAESIRENIGLGMSFTFSPSPGSIIDEIEETDLIEEIDILNSIDGDANEDGKTNIADAAFVMQAVGNKDKYKLSAQGEFNADSDGDGLTALDALTIQKKIAGIG